MGEGSEPKTRGRVKELRMSLQMYRAFPELQKDGRGGKAVKDSLGVHKALITCRQVPCSWQKGRIAEKSSQYAADLYLAQIRAPCGLGTMQ